jgi:tetratricopeptide (TPR) repeat protein
VAEELDMKQAARVSHNKSVELVHVKDLLSITCYLRGGCSPVGMKKAFPTYFDATMEPQKFVYGKARKGQDDDLMTIAHLTKAITLKDDFIEARLLRAEALMNLKQYKDMMEDIDAVLAQNPEEETAMLLRGKVKEADGKDEEAEEDYKLVTEINPFNEQAYLYLGQLYINQKKLTEAIGLFDEAIELNPNFAEAYKERGRAKLLNGDKDGSVEDMKKSLELNPKEEAGLNGEFKNLGPKPEALPGIF